MSAHAIARATYVFGEAPKADAMHGPSSAIFPQGFSCHHRDDKKPLYDCGPPLLMGSGSEMLTFDIRQRESPWIFAALV